MKHPEISLSLIHDARARIAQYVSPTPILPSVYLAQATGLEVFLKLENLNVSGSFKIRGASNALLSETASHLSRGVVAASAGNHAQGVAHVCQRLGVKATIFMPERTPLVKVEASRMLGAEVICSGAVFDDAYRLACEFEKQQGSILIHPYADPRVICGQGTIGLELLEQLGDLDAIIIPIGGGGLIGGVGCAIKSIQPNIKIFGVQSDAFPMMRNAWQGLNVESPKVYRATIADGIAVKSANPLNIDLAKHYVDDIFLVDEQDISMAVMDLIERNHLLAEGAGAVGVAALIRHLDPLKKYGLKRVAVIISGGNIDINLLTRIAGKGLISSGRLSRIKFTIPDKPGALAGLLQIVSSSGANLSEVHHDRTFSSSHYSDVEVEAVVETSNRIHREKLLEALAQNNLVFKVLD